MNAKQIKWGDRTWMNMGEQVRRMPSPRRSPRAQPAAIAQAPLFFGSLWTFALFVDAEAATALGMAYLFLRVLYPVRLCVPRAPRDRGHLLTTRVRRRR